MVRMGVRVFACAIYVCISVLFFAINGSENHVNDTRRIRTSVHSLYDGCGGRLLCPVAVIAHSIETNYGFKNESFLHLTT